MKSSFSPWSLVFALWAVGVPVTAAEGGAWKELFNGKDLTGWVQKGGVAKYTAENGELVGRTVYRKLN